MSIGLRKRLIAGLTKRFGYFGAPKYHAPRHRAVKEFELPWQHTNPNKNQQEILF